MQNVKEYLLKTPSAAQWSRIGVRNHHGICVPLFSLHSKDSCGIGEFHDLIPLFRWCQSLGFDVIQLLPLNDTSSDPSPYNALSAFALNPIHIGLVHLPEIKGNKFFDDTLHELKALSSTPRVDYAKVNHLKMQFLREYFSHVYPHYSEDPDFIHFTESNPWLAKYARFKALKIKTNWQSWEKWPVEWKTLPLEEFKNIIEGFEAEVAFHIFLQYLCFKQFKDVKEKAGDNGIFLKGDIPILISKESADVWEYNSLFLMEYSAGAPPDMYNQEGQNWGFPLYNWQEMEKQGYSWWKKRLETASHYYDIYRVDHVVGFYRIWAIPDKYSAKNGHFIPAEDWKWVGDGEKIMLHLLEASYMLPIGEDLGDIPPVVRQNLHKMGICGTKVMRWERNWNGDKSFIRYSDNDPISMTTVSTHDSETLKLWWKNNPEESKEFAKFKGWAYGQDLSVQEQMQILRDSHKTASLFHINLLQEYLALIPGMTSKTDENERINIPGTFSSFNWTYRFVPSVEEIIANPDLSQLMSSMVKG